MRAEHADAEGPRQSEVARTHAGRAGRAGRATNPNGTDIQLVSNGHPLSVNGRTQLTVITMGSVDSGKSTLTGVLSRGVLDNGDGSARQGVMVHPHEYAAGNTSDRSYTSYSEGNRIFTIVDMPGHLDYLRTTVTGMSATNPNLAICCISDKFTSVTIEHLSLCFRLRIPTVIAFTKTDLVPKHKQKEAMARLREWLRKSRSNVRLYAIDSVKRYLTINRNRRIMPVITLSNTNGSGVQLLRDILMVVPKTADNFLEPFVIDGIFTVTGYGSVVSGLVGSHIKKNSKMYLGPLSSGEFVPVHIRTIHNDFKLHVGELHRGCRGCVSLRMPSELRPQLRVGMVLRKTQSTANVCYKFQATMHILHHDTTIVPGYQVYINCGLVRGTVTFIAMRSTKTNRSVSMARSGHSILVDMKFLHKRPEYMEVGTRIIYREGKIRGTGVVTSIDNMFS